MDLDKQSKSKNKTPLNFYNKIADCFLNKNGNISIQILSYIMWISIPCNNNIPHYLIRNYPEKFSVVKIKQTVKCIKTDLISDVMVCKSFKCMMVCN